MSGRNEYNAPADIAGLIDGRRIIDVDYEPGEGYLVLTLDGPGSPSPTLYVDAPTLYTSPSTDTPGRAADPDTGEGNWHNRDRN